MLQHVSELSSFLRLSGILLYIYIPHFAHLCICRWTFEWILHFSYCEYCRCQRGCANVSSKPCFHLCWVYPDIELLDHMVILFFKDLPYCFPQWLYHFTFLPSVHQGSNFSTSSPTLVIFFYIVVILMDVGGISLWFLFIFT